MATQLGGQPILILKEGSSRTRGRDAQGMNIAAAKAVANAVRTTLGPKGMDKMLVDTIGDVVERLATAEGLHAHAASARIRRET